MLPPVDANETPKGMAEVVMIPVVAALVNAIFDATGHRFRSLAGDAEHDEGGADVTTLSVTINGRAYGPTEVRDELTMNDYLARISRAHRHQIRLRRGAMFELRGDRR